jgi:RimJ/RimL family protein N-acetyltransferase
MLFETPRLTLRPYDPDSDNDVADTYAMYADPEVVRYLSGQVCPELETQRNRLRERRTFYATLNNGTGVWAMVSRATGRVVGTALLKQLPSSTPEFEHGTSTSHAFAASSSLADLTDDFEIGWHLARAHWGNGFATEAARPLLHYGFTTLKLDTIYAVVNPANAASIRVTQRLGMTPLGRTRKYYNAEVELFRLVRSVQPQ